MATVPKKTNAAVDPAQQAMENRLSNPGTLPSYRYSTNAGGAVAGSAVGQLRGNMLNSGQIMNPMSAPPTKTATAISARDSALKNRLARGK